MRRLAHIINPVVVGEKSDLFVAQPITFASMRIAKQFAKGTVEVDVYTAQYAEDHAVIADWYQRTPDLNRSVLDFGNFQVPRKLPLIGDIIGRLQQASDAEYFIYTNVDIALMPSFYVTVNAIIDAGIDAFVINRRTLPPVYKHPGQLPLMYAEVGESHPGYDCFVFRRDRVKEFRLGHICVGIPKIGVVLAANLICFAKKFWEFGGLHLTFHIGNECRHNNPALRDYHEFNTSEAERIMIELAPHFDVANLPSVGLPWLKQHLERLKARPRGD